ncbi:MAG: hypothetical protein IKS83_06695 [Victivallales bacterium]|nr:hypothetical protein [Victivallales bacterium]
MSNSNHRKGNLLLLSGIAWLAICGASCRTTRPLSVDYGREAFLRGDYESSKDLLDQAMDEQIKVTQKSQVRRAADVLNKAAVSQGEYEPMFRDAFQTYFYLALNHLGQGNSGGALAELEAMSSRLWDPLYAQAQGWEEGAKEYGNEMENALAQRGNSQTEADYRKCWQEHQDWLNFADQSANAALARCCNPASCLLGAFLAGLANKEADRRDDRTFTFLGKVFDSGLAQETCGRISNGLKSPQGLDNKVLVIVASGKGPVLAARKVGVGFMTVFSFTSLPEEKEAMRAENGAFDPDASPVTVWVDDGPTETEVAAKMYEGLALEFAARERRLFWEQFSRIFIRDAAVVAGSQVGAKMVGDDHAVAKNVIRFGVPAIWLFARQFDWNMKPDLRCMQRSPWLYRVALVDIPKDRTLTLTSESPNDGEIQVVIPDGWISAVLYVDFHGHDGGVWNPLLLKAK